MLVCQKNIYDSFHAHVDVSRTLQQVTSAQLNKSLSEMFQLFYRRSVCLNCIRSLPAADVAYSGGASVHGAPATGQ